MTSVQTVCGPVPGSELGITLMHDHVFIRREHWTIPVEASRRALAFESVSMELLGRLRLDPYAAKDNLTLSDADTAATELRDYALCGGRTLVDPTPINLGRDAAALKRIAQTTGLNIVMGTGYYVHDSLPDDFGTRTVEEIRRELAQELDNGVGGSRIFPGIVGEIGTSAPITVSEEKSLRAAAQAATSVALSVHLDAWGREGHRVLDIAREEGVNPNRIILCHMNPSCRDLDYQMELADRGAYLGYDLVGMEYRYGKFSRQCPADYETAGAVLELISAGYLDRLLLSQDVSLKIMLKRYGGFGYSHILENYVPLLRYLGASKGQVDVMLSVNPARVLTGESTAKA